MTSRYGVRGATELAATMRGLSSAPSALARRKARFAALAPVKAAAISNLEANGSVETGALKQAQIIGDDPSGNKGRSVLGVKPGHFGKDNRQPVSYDHLVEFGTAPHWQPNRFGGIMHPGARPKPYKRRALEESSQLAIEAYRNSIAKDIAAAAERLRGRGR